MRVARYTLLRNLLLIQVAIIVIGVVVVVLVYYNASLSQMATKVSTLREQVTPVLAAKQEEWRAWKYLGLEEALEQDTGNLAKNYPIKNIKVILREQLPDDLPAGVVVLPDRPAFSLVEKDYVVYGEVDTASAYGAHQEHNILFWSMAAILFLFLVIILLSGRYVYVLIYLPIIRFLQAFSEYRAGGTIDLSHVHARGEIRAFFEVIESIWKRNSAYEKQAATLELASQVSHDIRSPLTALEVSLRSVSKLPEEERLLIRSAINRIKDIANNLTEKKTDLIQEHPEACLESLLLSSLIDPLITEKRIHFRSKLNIEIYTRLGPDSYGLFAVVDPVEFKRMLSNLIDNSVDAIEHQKGTVKVSLESRKSDEVCITVTDNGKGITTEVLSKLGHRGQTHGKAQGSGLGLFHARKAVEAWQGSLSIDSKVGKGTVVTVTLPRMPAPEWFVPKLVLQENATVVVLDDDSSVHQVWQGKLDAVTKSSNIHIVHFSTAKELLSYFKDNMGTMPSKFLVDQELVGEEIDGLSVIETLGIHDRSILVTSHYDKAAIRKRCTQLGVRLIPKAMAGFVPIEVEKGAEKGI